MKYQKRRASNEEGRGRNPAHIWRGHAVRTRTPAQKTPRDMRRIKAIFALFFIFVCAALLAVCVWYVSHSPYFSITSIEVRGAKSIPAQEVKDVTLVFLEKTKGMFFGRANIFLARKYLREEILKTIPRVATTELSVHGFSHPTLIIDISERALYAHTCAEDVCYTLDDTGFLFARAGVVRTSTLRISAASSTPSDSSIGSFYLPEVFEHVRSLHTELLAQGHSTKEFSIVGDEILVLLTDGTQLRVLQKYDRENLVPYLDLALSSEVLREARDRIEYIDLRFGNHVYYKLESK